MEDYYGLVSAKINSLAGLYKTIEAGRKNNGDHTSVLKKEKNIKSKILMDSGFSALSVNLCMTEEDLLNAIYEATMICSNVKIKEKCIDKEILEFMNEKDFSDSTFRRAHHNVRFSFFEREFLDNIVKENRTQLSKLVTPSIIVGAYRMLSEVEEIEAISLSFSLNSKKDLYNFSNFTIKKPVELKGIISKKEQNLSPKKTSRGKNNSLLRISKNETKWLEKAFDKVRNKTSDFECTLTDFITASFWLGFSQISDVEINIDFQKSDPQKKLVTI